MAVGDGGDSPHAEILNTQENIEAYIRAHDVVRIALATKRWTDEEAQELIADSAWIRYKRELRTGGRRVAGCVPIRVIFGSG